MGALGGALAPGHAASNGPPNVLFIISDQFHHAAYRAAGNPVIVTPHIDRLAREGVRFTNAVCATPFCSPTRASFLTGVYPHRHGITRNIPDSDTGLDPRLPTTEQALSQNGYTCRQHGKWHVGDRSRVPAYRDQSEAGYRRTEDRKRDLGPSAGRNGLRVFMTEAVEQANRNYDGKGPANTLIGRIDLPPEKMVESLVTDEALRELDRLAGKPFFLTVSLSAPHAPWEVGDPYYSRHPRSRIPLPANRTAVEAVDRSTSAWRFGQLLGEEGLREYLGVYYGLISMVDWNIGRLLDALRKHKLDQDTLVVFTADHGDMQGGHGCYDKTTFTMYEETTRVPLILRYPGRISPGKVVRTQAGTCDIQPTILDYAGLKPAPAIHGGSLRPFVEGREDLNRPMFSERERGQQHFQRLMRTLEWKYCYNSNGDSQLFNLEKDPGETTNLINDHSSQAVRRKLHAELAKWMRETADPRASALHMR